LAYILETLFLNFRYGTFGLYPTNYAYDGIILDRDDIDDENGIFSFSLSKETDHENDDLDPKTLSECQKRPDWEK